MQALLERYARIDFYDDFADDVGVPRFHYVGLARTLRSIDWCDFQHRVATVNAVLFQPGVTFTVYADARGTERLCPSISYRASFQPMNGRSSNAGLPNACTRSNAFLTDVPRRAMGYSSDGDSSALRQRDLMLSRMSGNIKRAESLASTRSSEPSERPTTMAWPLSQKVVVTRR